MTKTELIAAIAAKLSVSKASAEAFINAFLQTVTETLATGGSVTITGFGTFSVSHRAARSGVNPQNPSQKIQIAAHNTPHFKAGKQLKDAANKK